MAPTPDPRDLHQPQLAIRVPAMPADSNGQGDIFGGWLMSQVDIAGSTIACQVARGRIVTVAVNGFQFLKPVLVGDMVSCYARLIKTGRTSITVGVEVSVERDRFPVTPHKVAEAVLTYVAIDANRRPRPLGGSN